MQTMRNISHQSVETLIGADAAGLPRPALTMYAPMHTTASPPHISENQIRLKNLVRQAAEKLAGYPEGERLAKELHRTLSQVYDDLSFWENQTPGLLICARPGQVEMFHLPVDTDEYLAVDEAFHLAPVLALLHEDQPFYVLSVEQHQPRLFQGGMYGLQPAGMRLPASLHDALNIDEPNRKTENQASASGTSSSTSGFNGRGGARSPLEDDRLKFLRLIDQVVRGGATPGWPLVLAGTEAETAAYRAVSKYPAILEGTVCGSHQYAKTGQLFAKAYAIVQKEVVQPRREAAADEYQRLEGANPERVAHDLKSIQTATEQGRVEKLLAVMGRYTTDTIRDTLTAVSKITFLDHHQSRTLNRLAAKVWQMSGTIINMTPGEMPHGAPMLARLRY